MKLATPLQQAELVLAKIIQTLKNTPFWEELSVNTNEDLGPPTKLCDVKIKGRGVAGYETMLSKFWAKAAGRNPDSCFVSRDDAPKSFSLRTMNRLALVEFFPLLAVAFEGEPVEFGDIRRSWCWDHTEMRASGSPTHRTTYELHIDLGVSEKFSAGRWLKTALKNVCASTDPRADIEPFQLIEDELGENKCFSYQYTRTGVILEFETKADAEKAVNALYKDCTPVYSKPHRHEPIEVTLTFPS